MNTMNITVDDLKGLKDKHLQDDSHDGKIYKCLIESELKRREGAGRPRTSTETRTEQNRLAKKRERYLRSLQKTWDGRRNKNR